jgi:hypothetical protein
VNHRARLGWTLAVSLVLWLPVAVQILRNAIDAAIGGLYYLAALALAWFGTGVIMKMAAGYILRSRIEAQRAMKQIHDIERRHKIEAIEERRRKREVEAGRRHDDSDSPGAYDDDAPAVPRPRRSDGEHDDN